MFSKTVASLLLTLTFFLLVLVSCGESAPVASPTSVVSPTAEPVEEATPPSGPGGVQAALIETRLRGVSLPTDEGGVRAAFEKLPSQIGERQRDTARDERGPIRYAAYYVRSGSPMPDTQVIALEVSSGDFFPSGSTDDDVIAIFATGADWTVIGTGTDEGMAWVEYNTTATDAASGASQQVYVVQWGHPESAWVFGVQVEDPQQLKTVLDAFLVAVRSGPP